MTDQDASNSGRGAMTAREFCAPVLRALIDVVPEDDYELKWRLHDALNVADPPTVCGRRVAGWYSPCILPWGHSDSHRSTP